ncbi:Zonadhesin-like protein, partial [Leptotrombidium deliense]
TVANQKAFITNVQSKQRKLGIHFKLPETFIYTKLQRVFIHPVHYEVRNYETICISIKMREKKMKKSLRPFKKVSDNQVKCNKNEAYRSCGNRCKESCKSVISKINCPSLCADGCFCIDGYFRDKHRKCVPIYECSAMLSTEVDENILNKEQCKIDEVYKTCGNKCKESCNFKPNCPTECKAGCFCKEGYLKDSQGRCVAEYECARGPIIDEFPDDSTIKKGLCKNDEVYKTCGSRCKESCNFVERTSECKDECEVGCFCKNDYFRTWKGNCGPQYECKYYSLQSQNGVDEQAYFQHFAENCSENEKYTNCGNKCAEKCYAKFCPYRCETGCFCKEGYSRNEQGKCVVESKCTDSSDTEYDDASAESARCAKNEEYTNCGSKCAEKCNAKVCPYQCGTGCFCKKGYSRNKQGKCVVESTCTDLSNTDYDDAFTGHCKENEEFKECGSRCVEKCNAKRCPYEITCPVGGGCFCKKGYFRNKRGNLLSIQDAATKKMKSIQNVEVNVTRNVITVEKPKFAPMCVALDAFAKKDILETNKANAECRDMVTYYAVATTNYDESTTPIIGSDPCNEDEVYKQCDSKCKESCETRMKKRPCPYICESGCFCKDNYSRNSQGKCISEKQCLSDSKPEDRKTTTTPNDRDSTTQPDYRETTTKPDDRDSTTISDTTKMCKEHEIYKSCGSKCREKCEFIINRTTCIERCEKGCFCDGGYYRNQDGNCVRPAKCIDVGKSKCERKNFILNHNVFITEPVQCKQNEVYKECGNSCEEACDTTRNSKICAEYCEHGCFCDETFYRNSFDECVVQPECD